MPANARPTTKKAAHKEHRHESYTTAVVAAVAVVAAAVAGAVSGCVGVGALLGVGVVGGWGAAGGDGGSRGSVGGGENWRRMSLGHSLGAWGGKSWGEAWSSECKCSVPAPASMASQSRPRRIQDCVEAQPSASAIAAPIFPAMMMATVC